jgi:hypothetical protein
MHALCEHLFHLLVEEILHRKFQAFLMLFIELPSIGHRTKVKNLEVMIHASQKWSTKYDNVNTAKYDNVIVVQSMVVRYNVLRKKNWFAVLWGTSSIPGGQSGDATKQEARATDARVAPAPTSPLMGRPSSFIKPTTQPQTSWCM